MSSPSPASTDLLAADPAPPGQRPMLLASRPWLMVLAQFFPIIALAAVYPFFLARLSGRSPGGADLAVLIVTCAVITPTLAQAVAAPVYLHLLGERAKDPRFTARAVLRGGLPAVLVVSPLVLAAAGAAAAARQLPLPAFLELFGLLLLHVVMGALMVSAYALRAAVLLVVPWAVYVTTLLAAPTLIWLPALAASAAQVLVLALIATRRPTRGAEDLTRLHVTVRAAAAGALRGAAEGLPLWSIPVVVWLIDVRLSSIGFIYIALLPGVLAHQLFFVRVIDPAWVRLETARDALGGEPYAVARDRFDRFTRAIRAGVGQAVVLLVLLSLLLVAAAIGMHWAHGPLLLLIIAAAFAAVVAMMQSYTIAMVGSAGPLALLGSGALVIVGLGIGLRLPDALVLSVAAGFYLVCAGVFVLAGGRAMQRPEYALFWRRAVSW